MALPMSDEAAKAAYDAWLQTPSGAKIAACYQSEFMKSLDEALREPTPHVVRYRGRARTKHMYTPPTEFHWSNAPEGPTDSVWIAPGTI